MTEQPKRKPANKGRAFDIFKPGKAPTSSTSRPVITNRQPKAQDMTLKARPIQPTPNSRTRDPAVAQALLEAPEPEQLLPEHATPDDNHNGIFTHVDDGPLIVVGHGRSRRWLKILLIILAVLVVAAVVLDLLLDAGKLTLSVPHTNFLQH